MPLKRTSKRYKKIVAFPFVGRKYLKPASMVKFLFATSKTKKGR